MSTIQARRLTAEELAARLPGILGVKAQENAERAKAQKEWAEKQARYEAAQEMRREAIQFMASQEAPVVGASLRDKLLEASHKGLRVQGSKGKFLSIKKAANAS